MGNPTTCTVSSFHRRSRVRIESGVVSPSTQMSRALAQPIRARRLRMSASAPIPDMSMRRSETSLCANSDRMHRNKKHGYSITSSARGRITVGIVTPSALAGRCRKYGRHSYGREVSSCPVAPSRSLARERSKLLASPSWPPLGNSPSPWRAHARRRLERPHR